MRRYGLVDIPDVASDIDAVPITRTITINGVTYDLSANRTFTVGTVTSVGLSMPSAFTVTNSPITGSGTLTVTGAGTASQYIRGDGQLASFPTGGTGGGASVSYYLNGSVNQGTFSGDTYYEVNKTAIIGTGTDFSIGTNGYIAQFITDANDPNVLLIPSGNWDVQFYFSASSGGGNPSFYVELYKYDGTNFTLIASNSANPELIAFGTTISAYYTSVAVPETSLAITDRLAIKIYVTTSGRTITLHTEDNHLCEIVTTFTTGLSALNGLTKQVQYLAIGTSGTDFNISSVTDTHTFNLPTASATNRGALSTADWTNFTAAYNDKINSAAVTGTSTKTLTLTQQDGGTVTASWIESSAPVTSVFGRTGDVVAVSGDYSTTLVTEGTNLYFTDTRARNAISLTTTGSSGAATYISGVFNIPNYTIGGLGGVPTSRTLTINGTAFDLSADRSWSVGTVTSVAALTLGTSGTDLSSTVANGTTTPVITLNVPTASATNRGVLSSADWTTFNSKQGALTLTTNGIVGPATLSSNTLNIPVYNSIMDGIESGGVVSWSGTGLLFNVSACVYYINGVKYQTAATTITLTTADPTNPRIDVIAVNTSNAVVLITGTPASNPVEPQVNPDTQLQLTNVTVNAGATTPVITSELIYDENVETWTKTDTGFTSINYASTVNPYTGTKCILATAPITGTPKVTFTSPSPLSAKNYSLFKFAIKLGRVLATDERIMLQIVYPSGSGSVKIWLNWPTYNNGAFGFDSANTSWQLINIPLSVYVDQSKSISEINLSWYGLTTSLTFNLDRIELQSSNNTVPTTTIGIGTKINNATTGSVLFVGAAGILQQDNPNFFWDDTNNRLGIGTATPGNDITLSKNQNASTITNISNTTSGTASQSQLILTSDTTAGSGNLSKKSNTFTTSGIINLADLVLQNSTKGDIAVLNSFATGNIKFAAGASTTSQLTLSNAGVLTQSVNQNAATNTNISNTTSGTAAQSQLILTTDATAGSGNLSKKSNTFTTSGIINLADLVLQNSTKGDIAILNSFATGTIKFAAGNSSTAQLTIAANGNITQSVNQNASTNSTISNTTSGTAAQSQLILTSDATAGSGNLSKKSNTFTTSGIINLADLILQNDTKGDIGILNTFATGSIKFAAGNSTTAQLTLSSAGILTQSVNQNASTNKNISNTTSGTAAQSQLILTTDATAGSGNLSKKSNTFTTAGIINLADLVLQNSTKGDIAILNSFATGVIKLAAGNSSTSQAIIKTTGQLQLNNYTSSSSFTGTSVSALGIDASGNVITTGVQTGELDVYLAAQTYNLAL